MNFKTQETAQKLRGGYYTPEPIAEFLCRWAITAESKTILEPSCGDGRFLDAIYNVVRTNGINHGMISVDAVEISEEEASLALQKVERLRQEAVDVKVLCTDFFTWLEEEANGKTWNAVVGNPPYIRYQYWEETQRNRAEKIFRKANVEFTKRTNAWVPFVIGSIMHLRPGGRVAMVVPAEISYIMHAAGLRRLLEQELEWVRLLNFKDIVFRNTLQGTVLLLGIKRRKRVFFPLEGSESGNGLLTFARLKEKPVDFQIQELDDIDSLNRIHTAKVRGAQLETAHRPGGNWMLTLLTGEEQKLLEKICGREHVWRFREIADVDVGIVTGANKYFCVDSHTLSKYHLEDIAHPMLARSELIKGVTYNVEDHRQNCLLGRAVHFLEFPKLPTSELPGKMCEYVKLGESQGLHHRYKCRIREPWYCVPYVWVSPVSLLKRCHLYPRLVLNELGAYSTDTAYRVRMIDGFGGQEKDMIFCFINTFTLLLAELGGRHYAGGVLELVPSEIETLYVPLVKIPNRSFTQLDNMVRARVHIDEILRFTDKLVLAEGIGLTDQQILALKSCYRRIRARRLRTD